jgi:competence protein ComEA
MQFTQTKWVKEYFSFTKKERRAIAILGSVAILFAFLPTLFPFLVKDEIELVVDTSIQQQIAALKVISETKDSGNRTYTDADLYQPKESRFERYRRESGTAEMFVFDPNTATEEEWQRLGLRAKTIQTILKYRTKGGKFFKPDDLQRIYGLRPDDYKRLAPYVQIKESSRDPATSFTAATKTERKEYAGVTVNINTADTTEWRKLKGIGSGYARRIVNFRSKLGGFVTVEQVKETFGLPDSVFQQIKTQLQIDPARVKQMDVNIATVDELKAHPYIGYAVANAIVQYRKEHGNFTVVGDLQKIGAIDPSLYQKISPYLAVK